jgi:hypothetical protein
MSCGAKGNCKRTTGIHGWRRVAGIKTETPGTPVDCNNNLFMSFPKLSKPNDRALLGVSSLGRPLCRKKRWFLWLFDLFGSSDHFSKEEAARRREELEKQKDELRAIEEVAVDLGVWVPWVPNWTWETKKIVVGKP